MKPFVLYSLRHTFLTRLGQSGCGAWTLARIAGHSSIAISSRYVHPSEETVLAAFSRLGGHNFGSNAEKREIVTDVSRAEAIAFKEKTGAPGEIRTPDLLLRRQSLHPAELRARPLLSLHTRTCGSNALCWRNLISMRSVRVAAWQDTLLQMDASRELL
jgi:thymidylate synthase ThyX